MTERCAELERFVRGEVLSLIAERMQGGEIGAFAEQTRLMKLESDGLLALGRIGGLEGLEFL